MRAEDRPKDNGPPPGKMRITVQVNDTEYNSYKIVQHLNDVYGADNGNTKSVTAATKS